jgi:hypothetical protein
VCATFRRLARRSLGPYPRYASCARVRVSWARTERSYPARAGHSPFPAQRRTAVPTGVAGRWEAALTTVWGAPRRAYELARDLAAGDRDAVEGLWKGMGSSDRADLVIALGAQARFVTRTARMADGTPVPMPADLWDWITCPEVREFTVDAWSGRKIARMPPNPCGYCLRVAAEALAELHLVALTAVGVPPERLAEICARAAARAATPVTSRPARSRRSRKAVTQHSWLRKVVLQS